MKLKTTFLLASILTLCISSVFANFDASVATLSSSNNLVPNYQFKDGDGNPSLDEWENTSATAPNSITAVTGVGESHQVLISKSDLSGNWSDVKMGLTWQDFDLSGQDAMAKLTLSAKVKASNDDGMKFRLYLRYRTRDIDDNIVNNNVYSDVFVVTSTEQEFTVPLEIPNDAFQWNLEVQFGGTKSGAAGDLYFSTPSLSLDAEEEEKPVEPSDPDNIIPDDKFADNLGNPTLAVWSNTSSADPNSITAVEGTTNFNKVLINKVDGGSGNWSSLVLALPWQDIDLPQDTEMITFELSAKVLASNEDGAKFRFNFRYKMLDGENNPQNYDVNSNQFVITSSEKTFTTTFEVPKDAYQWNLGVQFGGVDSGAPADITFSHPILKIIPSEESTDEEMVAEAKENLVISFASGDDAMMVTQNVTLPVEGDNEVAVSWVSSNTSVISNDGVVVRQDVDIEVTLTATLSKNDVSDTKDFVLKVLGESAPAEPEVDNLIPNFKFTDDLGAPSFDGWTKNTAEAPNTLDVIAGVDDHNIAVVDKQNSDGNWNALIIGLPWQNIDYSDQEDSVAFTLSAKLKASNDDGAIFRFYFRYRTKDENGLQVNNDIYSDRYTLTSSEEVYTTSFKLPKDAYQWNLSVQFGGSDSGAPAEILFSYPKLFVEEADQGPTDEEKLAEAVEALEVLFADGNDANNVSQNITLVNEGLNNTTVTWDASAHANITNDGEVTITDDEVTADIVATVTLGDLSGQKSFTLTTAASSDDVIVERVAGKLEVEYAEGDSQEAVTASVTLTTSYDEYEEVQIEWESSNDAVITSTGVLTVPMEVTEVTLTATITLNETSTTKSFVLTVLNNEEELIQEAFDALAIIYAEGDSTESVTSDLTLITEGLHNSEISWVSDRTTITNEGVVTRSFRDINTNLTATIQLGQSTMVKEFEVIVIAEQEVTSIDQDKVILNVYPNPTFGDVTLTSSLPFQGVDIYNLIGVKVKTIQFVHQTQKTTLNLDDLPRGQYILRVNNQPIKFIKK
ncbi:immunoglobulin-like domain-containing protein [Flammeovirga sp. SubArs3]|uniref:immunoglobulin-like domain-containing protein n=1 Tax=Flammeovirga sp. SubArs3 TaxID=2995316 RepID=UPI00248BF83F|nr:immunoglobulin-like domain-containing protein [Flammeovirga sp. SubArs3]